jgi:hypothetical protein
MPSWQEIAEDWLGAKRVVPGGEEAAHEAVQ